MQRDLLLAAARERSEHLSPLAPVSADPGGPIPPNQGPTND